MEIREKINKQNEFFFTGKTLDINYRKDILNSLKKGILEMEDEICEALKKDLGKSYYESYMCEICLLYTSTSIFLDIK